MENEALKVLYQKSNTKNDVKHTLIVVGAVFVLGTIGSIGSSIYKSINCPHGICPVVNCPSGTVYKQGQCIRIVKILKDNLTYQSVSVRL